MDDKDRINKEPTAAAQGTEEEAFDITGNVRKKGQDPSPDDRERGERSDAEPSGTADARRR